jgi:hypothetical protein
MARKPRVKQLTVIGRRWFQKGVGNTYHSVAIIVNGEWVEGVDYAYGYGDQYLQSAEDKLAQLGYITDREKYSSGLSEPLWRYCERKGIKFTYTHVDVARKRDL